jgi:hypothetical protein
MVRGEITGLIVRAATNNDIINIKNIADANKNTIAFGTFLPLIVLGQFLAKLAGGLIWSIVIIKLLENKRMKENA